MLASCACEGGFFFIHVDGFLCAGRREEEGKEKKGREKRREEKEEEKGSRPIQKIFRIIKP
jgi:hypothetical protein